MGIVYGTETSLSSGGSEALAGINTSISITRVSDTVMQDPEIKKQLTDNFDIIGYLDESASTRRCNSMQAKNGRGS